MSSSELTPYLKTILANSSQKVEFKQSIGENGLGGFAREYIAPNETIFKINRNLILSSSTIKTVSDNEVQKLSQCNDLTSETLLFYYIAKHKDDGEYLSSLPSDIPKLIEDELRGTNIYSQLISDMAELESQYELICKFIPDTKVTLELLAHSRALYNSRRYPEKFAINSKNREKRKRHHDGTHVSDDEEEKSRRVYDLTQGSLVPLLDVLNHDSEHDYLKFKVEDDTLHVIANIAIEKGMEIYSNYGCTSNDQFLLQFGFCCERDDFNVFAVKVGSNRYELTLDNIPEELLADGGHGLRYHLKSKLKALPAKDHLSTNIHVAYYMKEQRKLLKGLIKRLSK